MTDKYRFETGTLFEYDEDRNAYFAVYTNARDNTKAKAIRAYEGSL